MTTKERPWMDGAPLNPETERMTRIMESVSESDYDQGDTPDVGGE